MHVFPLGYRVAQAIGLTGAAWLSGNIAAFSMNAAPALLRAHNEDHLPAINVVRLWRNLYESGKSQNPPIAVVTASAFFYLAWSTRSSSPLFRQVARSTTTLYGAAAILTLSIMPYTIAVMSSTNNALLAESASNSEPTSLRGTEIEQLVSKWISLNGFRSLLPLAGCLLGAFATLA
ncbi:hypothetical protein AbraIFM66950_010107 [Aspergillus brasiliensis]|nr:hypothetical protein AbraIFM66950_010107 [Aspergillus brasiliensis]